MCPLIHAPRQAIVFTLTKAITHILLFSVCALIGSGQTSNHDQIQELAPNQTLEREMTGTGTHRYKFDLQANEFFQVRVEQRGVDVALKLTDAGDKVLVTMDGPNGKDGPETLTFVAAAPGNYVLEVSGFDPKAEKGIYTIRREATRTGTAKDRRRVEVEQLLVAGIAVLVAGGQSDTATRKLAEALAGWAEVNDKYMVELTALTLVSFRLQYIDTELQSAQRTLGEGQKLAMRSHQDLVAGRVMLNEALDKFRILSSKLNDKTLREAIADCGAKSEEYLNYLQRNQFSARLYEGVSLDGIALAYHHAGEWQKSVEYRKLTLAVCDDVFQSFKSFKGGPNHQALLLALQSIAAGSLHSLGQTYKIMGQRDEALNSFNQSLERLRALYQKTQKAETKLKKAIVLQDIAFLYTDEVRTRKIGIEFLWKAVKSYRSLPDSKASIARVLNIIGGKHLLDMDYESALSTYEDALRIYRELGDPIGQMDNLFSMGAVYVRLDNKAKVQENFSQALLILERPDYATLFKKHFDGPALPQGADLLGEILDTVIEYHRLGRIGFAYERLEQYEKASQYHEKALAVARLRQHADEIRSELRSIAYDYAKLEKWQQSADYYLQALNISRNRRVKEEIADDLADAGWTLMEGGKPREALSYQSEALGLYQSVGIGKTAFSLRYGLLFHEVARTYDALNNRALAIFFGKQDINAIQRERQQLRNLDAASQRGFLRRNEKHYRRLAQWLIAAGRVPEAEEVLQMLKEDEYFQYLRRDYQVAQDLLFTVDLNPDEAAAAERYDQFADRLTLIGKEYGELEAEKNKTVPKRARLAELKRMLDDARVVSQKYLDELELKFKQYDVRLAEIKSGFQSMLNELGARHTAVVSTIVDDERLTIFVTTADSQRVHAVDLKAVEVNKLVEDFRAAVTNPTSDPRDAGKKLYDVLVKPIENDLAGIYADTIVWSLDGTLRYAPMAALWDGRQYLAERYANVVITLASQQNLKLPISNRIGWRALGAGVSREYENLPALRAVPDELDCIITDPVNKTVSLHPQCNRGVVTGRKLLDESFTKENFTNSLGRYAVVHLASHFSLQPGDAHRSFLLLGGGATDKDRKLALSEINQNFFKGVEILTLSACNTAVGTERSNGLEVEAFSVKAQKEGAKAVIATLWAVADPSTRDFMVKFYSVYDPAKHVNKAEALRLAQLALLRGRNSDKATAPAVGRSAERIYQGAKTSGPFKPDTNAKYSHPYYWAPFILIGNWR